MRSPSVRTLFSHSPPLVAFATLSLNSAKHSSSFFCEESLQPQLSRTPLLSTQDPSSTRKRKNKATGKELRKLKKPDLHRLLGTNFFSSVHLSNLAMRKRGHMKLPCTRTTTLANAIPRRLTFRWPISICNSVERTKLWRRSSADA